MSKKGRDIVDIMYQYLFFLLNPHLIHDGDDDNDDHRRRHGICTRFVDPNKKYQIEHPSEIEPWTIKSA